MTTTMLQVHGIVNDTIEFVKGVLTTEMNSATDNPVSLVTATYTAVCALVRL